MRGLSRCLSEPIEQNNMRTGRLDKHDTQGPIPLYAGCRQADYHHDPKSTTAVQQVSRLLRKLHLPLGCSCVPFRLDVSLNQACKGRRRAAMQQGLCAPHDSYRQSSELYCLSAHSHLAWCLAASSKKSQNNLALHTSDMRVYLTEVRSKSG